MITPATVEGAGVTGDPAGGYIINNDYFYPRFTVPPQLRRSTGTTANQGSAGTYGYYANQGLLRGWIYPIDSYDDLLATALGSTTVDEARENMSAAEAERATRDAATAQFGQAVLDQAVASGQVSAAAVEGALPVGASSSVLTANYTANASVPKQIRYREGKQFQFNPMSIEFTIEMTAAAPTETVQSGGTAGNSQVGGVGTKIELLFDRTLETAAATQGVKSINGLKVDPIFADIGVQKDLWDVYRIILGGDETYWQSLGSHLINITDVTGGTQVQDGSVTDMANRLFDLGVKGSSAYGRRVALFYNPNVVVVGDVMGLGFTYAEFNANYVPIKAKVDISLSVLSTTSESGADEYTGAVPDTDEETTSGGNGNSGTVTPTATATVHARPLRTNV